VKRFALALIAFLFASSMLAQNMPPGKWWRKPEIAQVLGLTTEQQNKLENVWLGASSELIDLKGEVEKQNIALRIELDRPQLDRKGVQNAAARLNIARGRLFERELLMLVDMRSVLTDPQWARMRNVLDRLNNDRPMQQRPNLRRKP
jgi:Heavy-metal resistance